MRGQFRLGVVEGFFGRQWSWEARTAYAAFLSGCGCNSYLYAPKNDPWLRKFWQHPFPTGHTDQLSALREQYRSHRIDFGIGLSPFELYRNFSPGNRELLRRKLEAVNAIAPDTLCLLFDDMQGDLANLAAIQAEIVAFATELSSASSFIVCPTYYSSDPALNRYFGQRPERYLEDLGKTLDPAIDIFWTGPRVISADYPASHLRQVAEQLGRKPLLWDNYPVNDARRLTPFLHLLPPTGREPAELRQSCSGHLANPMNQAWLSRLPLWALAKGYRQSGMDRSALFHEACTTLCTPALAKALQEDVELFQNQGLELIQPTERGRLLQKYAAINDPAAAEVVEWLQGGYAFDPACLT